VNISNVALSADFNNKLFSHMYNFDHRRNVYNFWPACLSACLSVTR